MYLHEELRATLHSLNISPPSLCARLTEVGTLELECHATETEHRWRLRMLRVCYCLEVPKHLELLTVILTEIRIPLFRTKNLTK